MKTALLYSVLFAALLASANATTLAQFNYEFEHFQRAPTQEHFQRIQAHADQLAGELKQKGNNVDLLTAVFIARAAEKYHWPITGKSAIAKTAREIAGDQGRLSSYVRDDRVVDLKKLDIWWASFFATGETSYLADLLRVARYPHTGEHAADFMVPAMAAWSFKSNCRQNPSVRAFAKKALERSSSPEKKAFLQECLDASTTAQTLSTRLVTASDKPPRRTRIVIRHLGQPAGFPSQPTVEYFAGRRYGRVEEALDSVNHIHGLGITNEPNLWLINFLDHTGRHIVDLGPTFNLHVPIFTTETKDGHPVAVNGLEDLEYGHEMQFFRRHRSKEGKREVEAKSYSSFSFTRGAIEVTLLVIPKNGHPFEIEERMDGKVVQAMRYLSYEIDIPFQKELFEPPKGIRMVEAR